MQFKKRSKRTQETVEGDIDKEEEQGKAYHRFVEAALELVLLHKQTTLVIYQRKGSEDG